MQNDRITLRELERIYDTEEKCLWFFTQLRWPDGVVCPYCNKTDKIIQFKNGKEQGVFQCGNCEGRRKFSVKTNTFMGSSKIPLSKWMYAIWRIINSKSGVTSLELARDLRISQRTAMFMGQRIRNAEIFDDIKANKLNGEVEVDETFIGGKEDNRKKHRKTYDLADLDIPVLGMLERGGSRRLVLQKIDSREKTNIEPYIKLAIAENTIIYTDEHASYEGLEDLGFGYKHRRVKHRAKQYVKYENGNQITTNRIESVWSSLKHSFRNHVSITEPHLQGYLNIFCFRWNAKKTTADGEIIKMTDFERFVHFMQKINGSRIKSRDLLGLYLITRRRNYHPPFYYELCSMVYERLELRRAERKRNGIKLKWQYERDNDKREAIRDLFPTASEAFLDIMIDELHGKH